MFPWALSCMHDKYCTMSLQGKYVYIIYDFCVCQHNMRFMLVALMIVGRLMSINNSHAHALGHENHNTVVGATGTKMGFH